MSGNSWRTSANFGLPDFTVLLTRVMGQELESWRDSRPRPPLTLEPFIIVKWTTSCSTCLRVQHSTFLYRNGQELYNKLLSKSKPSFIGFSQHINSRSYRIVHTITNSVSLINLIFIENWIVRLILTTRIKPECILKIKCSNRNNWLTKNSSTE